MTAADTAHALCVAHGGLQKAAKDKTGVQSLDCLVDTHENIDSLA